jgi:hypothetical protein
MDQITFTKVRPPARKPQNAAIPSFQLRFHAYLTRAMNPMKVNIAESKLMALTYKVAWGNNAGKSWLSIVPF